jgi:hypothetical protein
MNVMSPLEFEKINRLNNPYFDMGVEALDRIFTYGYKNADLDLRRKSLELQAIQTAAEIDNTRRRLSLEEEKSILNSKAKELQDKLAQIKINEELNKVEAQNFLLNAGVDSFSDAKSAEGFSTLPDGVKAIINQGAMEEKRIKDKNRFQNQFVYGILNKTIDDPKVLSATGGDPEEFARLFTENPDFREHAINTKRRRELLDLAVKNGVPINETMHNLLENPYENEALFLTEVMNTKQEFKNQKTAGVLDQEIAVPTGDSNTKPKMTKIRDAIKEYIFLNAVQNDDAKERYKMAFSPYKRELMSLADEYPIVREILGIDFTQDKSLKPIYITEDNVIVDGKPSPNLSDTFSYDGLSTDKPSKDMLKIGGITIGRPQGDFSQEDSLDLGKDRVTVAGEELGKSPIIKSKKEEKILDLPIDNEGNVLIDKIVPYQKYRYKGEILVLDEEKLKSVKEKFKNKK